MDRRRVFETGVRDQLRWSRSMRGFVMRLQSWMDRGILSRTPLRSTVTCYHHFQNYLKIRALLDLTHLKRERERESPELVFEYL